MKLSCLIQAIGKIPEIGDRARSIQSQHSIAARLREAAINETLEDLTPFENLSEQYQISTVVLWDCLLALKSKPHELRGQTYLSIEDLKRLDRFIKRIEIAWACPHILRTCRREISKNKAFPML